MSSFESIIDQKRPVRILTTFLKKQTIPHALLFTGIEGVGKKSAATAFAMACNCIGQAPKGDGNIQRDRSSLIDQPITTEPCSVCRSCRKILSGNHPDVIHIGPSGPFIRIAQIRALCDTLAMKPYEAKLRVVIIENAQTMNPPAGNALLKMLEEPPDKTILILMAPQKADLLPTIVSRCQSIRFAPVTSKTITAMLIEENNIDPEDATVIAAMASGSKSRALEMTRSGWIPWRNWLIAASGLNRPESLPARPPRVLLAFGEQLAKNKDLLSDAMETMVTWLRDLIVCKYDPEKVINADLVEKLQATSSKITTRSLISKIETIQTAQKDIRANSNLRLTLEVMMLRLAKDCDKGSLSEKMKM